MAEFLLELLSEEIPAGMQMLAGYSLNANIYSNLKKTGFFSKEMVTHTFSTPRRLAVSFKDVLDVSEATPEERKGPRVDAPQQAIDGFLRSCGLATKDDLFIEEDKKGKFYVARIVHKGYKLEDALIENLPRVIRDFSWSKSMWWGEGRLRWVRPLHSILAIVDGKQIDFEIGGIKSGNTTRRFFNDSKPIRISSFKDYCAELKNMGVIGNFEERVTKIQNAAKSSCENKGLDLIINHDYDTNPDNIFGQLGEIAGLVETPFCIMGQIDERFLDLPPEVLQTSMKVHQKFLSVADKKGQITHFITVANKYNPSKEAVDTIRKGNERVLSARLADAKFFWENDLCIVNENMKDWEDKLQRMTYHNLLGTQGERVNRIANFAKSHVKLFDANPKDAEATAKIMKLDLCSSMVGEFPELQGIMGEYYAKQAGYNADIALACKEHYAPLGRYDAVPTAPLSVAMAIADKLDTLAGFWAVGIIPTSSKDPFALRRAALGVIRIILDNNLRLSLTDLLNSAFKPFPKKDEQAQDKLMDFFHERLKIYLDEPNHLNIPADTIDACRFGQGETDFALLTNRAKALHAFRPDAEFQNLLQGFKRAHNILHAEQKKDGVFYEMPPEPQYFQDPTETELHEALNAAETALPPLMEKEQFAQMLQTLANLRAPIDAFFTQVQVNSDQSAVRRNRLCLLHKLCSVMKTFADFSRLNG